jgi:hypothetical protein
MHVSHQQFSEMDRGDTQQEQVRATGASYRTRPALRTPSSTCCCPGGRTPAGCTTGSPPPAAGASSEALGEAACAGSTGSGSSAPSGTSAAMVAPSGMTTVTHRRAGWRGGSLGRSSAAPPCACPLPGPRAPPRPRHRRQRPEKYRATPAGASRASQQG